MTAKWALQGFLPSSPPQRLNSMRRGPSAAARPLSPSVSPECPKSGRDADSAANGRPLTVALPPASKSTRARRRCRFIRSRDLRLAEAIEQGPGEHKGHQPTKHIARPEVRKRPEEVGFRVALRLERVDEHGNNSRAYEVEDEPRPGFQSESACGYAEERRGQRANVRDGLWRVSC